MIDPKTNPQTWKCPNHMTSHDQRVTNRILNYVKMLPTYSPLFYYSEQGLGQGFIVDLYDFCPSWWRHCVKKMSWHRWCPTLLTVHSHGITGYYKVFIGSLSMCFSIDFYQYIRLKFMLLLHYVWMNSNQSLYWQIIDLFLS